MCPVCTVTVIAGLGISRLLGIDDLVSAIWIGGLILSLSFVTVAWIGKKWPKLKSKYYYFPTFVLMYLFVLIPFKLDGTIGIIRNTIWGIDKIIFGIFIGSVAFLTGMWADKKVRAVKGKQLFAYQKVVFPILALLITSLVFFFITR
ncbi:MAG: hypothetical protein NT162_01145 [Candidatus Woesebacteria bacterium]|nr:hypothetical protein [Candidatus Woesebacteria bacterium]